MECANPDHMYGPPEVCAGCYAALEREHTALNDRYMRLLAENGELERKVREAGHQGDVIPLPHPLHVGAAAYESGPAGFEAVQGTDALQVLPRSRQPSEDVAVIRIFQRTMGPDSSGRGQLLTRATASALYAWLGWWLVNGWPGVPRRCGQEHSEAKVATWRCDQEPDHLDDHEGPAIGWYSEAGKPGRESWPLPEDVRRARYRAGAGER
jgi:hypothetical protein